MNFRIKNNFNLNLFIYKIRGKYIFCIQLISKMTKRFVIYFRHAGCYCFLFVCFLTYLSFCYKQTLRKLEGGIVEILKAGQKYPRLQYLFIHNSVQGYLTEVQCSVQLNSMGTCKGIHVIQNFTKPNHYIFPRHPCLHTIVLHYCHGCHGGKLVVYKFNSQLSHRIYLSV